MSATASSSIPILLGPSFKTKPQQPSTSSSSSRQSLVSVKYNFIPPSISKDNAAFLHCPKKTSPEWLLEYSGSGSHSNDAQSFTGVQSAAKDIDCVLVWDKRRKVYVLDQIGSGFSLKFDRKHTQLTKDAKEAFTSLESTESKNDKRIHALGLDIPDQQLETQSSVFHADEVEEGEDVEMGEGVKEAKEEDEESDDFARQLQLDLEEIEDGQPAETGEEEGSLDDAQEKSGTSSPKDTRTGLGLVGVHGNLMHQEEVITPRGSPYIERSAKVPLPSMTNAATSVPNSTQMRSTPGMSPLSVANSPRPVGLESSLSATWRPPAQRSAVAMAYDGDEDDEDDEDESDEEEEEEEDDDDLDAFARQLEGSLMEPPTPVDDKKRADESASSTTRTSRSGGRVKR